MNYFFECLLEDPNILKSMVRDSNAIWYTYKNGDQMLIL